jgi:hypothetical protein
LKWKVINIVWNNHRRKKNLSKLIKHGFEVICHWAKKRLLNNQNISFQ